MERDPIDLLIEVEKLFDEPIRPEFLEGKVVVPKWPEGVHDDGAQRLAVQLMEAGVRWVGVGKHFRPNGDADAGAQLTPDFYVTRRQPTYADDDEYGRYPADLLALACGTTTTGRRSRHATYAAAGVPVYVLISREAGTARAFSAPERAQARYRTTTEVKPGHLRRQLTVS
jgi:hypothetical protein